MSAIGTAALRTRYAMAQAARVAWYGGNGWLMRRRLAEINAAGARAARARTEPQPPPDEGAEAPGTPASRQDDASGVAERDRAAPRHRLGWNRLLADVAALLAADLQNVEHGLYPMPADLAPDGLPGLVATMRRFHADAEAVARRRLAGASQEAAETAPHLPRYYRQNFHFQTGGWLTEESARLYDTQVEVLFTGAAAAMRRQALVPIAGFLKERDQRRVRFADIASGTGLLLADLSRAFPRLAGFAFDLSEPYLREGGRLRQGRGGRFMPVVADAERLPVADGTLDLATSVYLFHELPPTVRRAVAREMGRVLAPGGLVVLVDSLQRGDVPDYDDLLGTFPVDFHEPYYAGYLEEDLGALFAHAGLVVEASWPAFLSKVVVLRRGSAAPCADVQKNVHDAACASRPTPSSARTWPP